jgi:ribosomal protein S18 acetylase RimI-like enzyme
MLIRQATVMDYAGICAVLSEVDALHREALPQVFRDPGTVVRSRAYIASIVEDENAGLWVAEDEGQIVGLLNVSARETRDLPILVPRRYAVIENLAVAAAYRRRGIGRALMQVADDWALAKGIEQVELHVYEFNEGARAFYEALGYQTASRNMWRDLAVREISSEPDSL